MDSGHTGWADHGTQCLHGSCLHKMLPRCVLLHQVFVASLDWHMARHFHAAIPKPSSYVLPCFEAAPSWMPPQLDCRRNLNDRWVCLCVWKQWGRGSPEDFARMCELVIRCFAMIPRSRSTHGCHFFTFWVGVTGCFEDFGTLGLSVSWLCFAGFVFLCQGSCSRFRVRV